MRSFLLLSMTVGALIGPTVAATAFADVPEKAAAEALFQSGRELVEQGRHAEGCEKLEGSLALDPALGTRLHLADCYERIGKVASAWATFEEAASTASASGQTERERIARTRARALADKLSKIEVRVPEEAKLPGLQVRVASVIIPQAAWGTEWPLDPGDHEIEVSAPGHHGWTTHVSVMGDSKRVVVRVPLLAESPAPMEQPSPPAVSRAVPVLPPPPPSGDAADAGSGSAQATVAVITIAVGAAGLAAGGVLGIQAIRKNDESLGECRPDDETRCTAEGVALRDEAQDYALGSTIALGAGGAVAVTGLLLILTAPDAPVRELAASMTPSFSMTGASLTIQRPW